MMKNKKSLDIAVSRCEGLRGQTALRCSDYKIVHADGITKKDGPFFCPECLSDAVIRKCTEKVNHFAHKARQSPIISAKETKLHNQCRDEIFQAFKTAYPDGNWATERTIEANFKGKKNRERVPDISGKVGGNGIAIEIQKSAYTIQKIYDKTVDYKLLNIFVIWIIPLSKELGSEPFRPRLFEKYLHSLNKGRVYYYLPGSDATVQLVHYSPAKRYIEYVEWIDDNKELQFHGGYDLTYKTIKSPNYGPLLNLTKDFICKEMSEFTPSKNEKKKVPARKLYWDSQNAWWDKDERNDMSKQTEVIRGFTEIEANYSWSDSYDEFDEIQ
jgi:competence protein CoiA